MYAVRPNVKREVEYALRFVFGFDFILALVYFGFDFDFACFWL